MSRVCAFFEISITSSCGMMVPLRVFSSAMIRVGALKSDNVMDAVERDFYFETHTCTSVPETIRGSMSSQVRWCSGHEEIINKTMGPIAKEYTISRNDWDAVSTGVECGAASLHADKVRKYISRATSKLTGIREPVHP